MLSKPILVLNMLFSISNMQYAADIPYERTANYSNLNQSSEVRLSSKSISLKERYDNEFVNGVFRDNILLTLNYLNGNVKNKSNINWGEIQKPSVYKFDLQPGESFAFHDQILPKYKGDTVRTTNAHFNYQDGFKSDGYLVGDGVCHLASLIYWAVKGTTLEADAPSNHDFAKINGVPKEYGVSIYSLPGGFQKSANQNLYIKNNQDKTVTFNFTYDGTNLMLEISKSDS